MNCTHGRLVSLCALAIAGFANASFAAAIIPVQRTSTIDVWNGASRTYTGLGVYNDAILDEYGGASQISSLAPQVVSFDCTLRGARVSEITFTMGTSSLDLVFDIDQATPFAIAADGYGCEKSMTLNGPGVALVSPAGLNTTGTFVPGRYTLSLAMATTASISDPIPTINDGTGWFRLTIPEPLVAALFAPAMLLKRRR